jgi:hypothetical protein
VAHTHSSRYQVNSHTTHGNSRRYSFVADREPSRALGNETLGLSCHDPPQGYLLTGACLTSRRMDFQPRSAIRLSKSLQCLQLWDGWEGQERFGFLHFAFDWMHRAEWLPTAGLGYNSPHLQEPTRAPLLPIEREGVYSFRGPPLLTYHRKLSVAKTKCEIVASYTIETPASKKFQHDDEDLESYVSMMSPRTEGR